MTPSDSRPLCIDCGSDKIKIGVPKKHLTLCDGDEDFEWRCQECDVMRRRKLRAQLER